MPDTKRWYHNHPGAILWFTGFSGSGKSTLSQALHAWLAKHHHESLVVDGDIFREGLCKDLGFSIEDRKENIRRIGEISYFLAESGIIAIVGLISPFRNERRLVRNKVRSAEFVEIFCDCPLEVCEARDPEGLYAKARAGELKQFTGLTSPYERPESAEIVLKTAQHSVEECTVQILNSLHKMGIVHL